MSLNEDAERLAWAWTRLLVKLGVGRARRAFYRWLDGPHLRDRWRAGYGSTDQPEPTTGDEQR